MIKKLSLVFLLTTLSSISVLAGDDYTPMMQEGKIITIFSNTDGEKKPTVEELRKIKKKEAKNKSSELKNGGDPKVDDSADDIDDSFDEEESDSDDIDAEDEGE